MSYNIKEQLTDLEIMVRNLLNTKKKFPQQDQENLRGMKKDTFAVAVNATDRRYVYQMVDEANKNHGFLVMSIVRWLRLKSKLHQQVDCLWQRPFDSFEFDGPILYCMTILGTGKLAGMMNDISNLAQLS
ncbi:hypothetical protein MAR_010609 [Mya arenaria]|uniref:Uncharacterized protein n=1 Tax=Mya arenaria TaxID=6604 RepID=A0ABY7E675_MYAAR|nr:hypothetical protein MAR_010609 [Mya arenaria]